VQVAILHNAMPADAPLEDLDTLVQVEAVTAALGRLGHATATVACTLDLGAVRDAIEQLRPDVVFNLVESLAGADSLVYLPPAMLDVMGVPYAGGRTEALFLTTHKLLAKHQLRAAGLPTADWIEGSSVIHEGRERHEGIEVEASPASSSLPESFASSSSSLSSSCSSWIIKGVWDQASRGMDDDAVVRDAELTEVRRRLAERTARSAGACFAERFIEGREFNLSVLAGPRGPEVLPPAEIDFSAFPPEKPRIVGHRAKWQADSFEFQNTPRRFDLDPSDRDLTEQLRSLAERCWMLFDLRGWARVDFRVDAGGRPWILEVNSNPCLAHDAGFAAALARAGISFDNAIQRILDDAFRSS
jgi:D-alanine-D-alanine ligase